MSYWRLLWLALKMIYQLLCCSVSLIFFCFNVFWLFCNLAIPWCTLTLLVVCIASKFVKLQRSPNEKRLLSLLSSPEEWPSYWPIANRAAGFDAPENSKAAIKKVGDVTSRVVGNTKINNIPFSTPLKTVPRTWISERASGCRPHVLW